MTPGEHIAALRSEKKLSQEDLAEKLNVSRPSVSQWETGASVPELDKLLLLSEVFGLSLDQLVKGDGPTASAPALSRPKAAPRAAHGALCVQNILGLLPGRSAGEGFFLLGVYLLLCGTVCLWVKRYAGLTIGWVTVALVLLIAPYWTGIQVFAVLNPGFYAQGISVNQALVIGFWAFVLLLAAATVRRFLPGTKKQ